MVRFVDKQDIINWIELHTTRRSVLRALKEGAVEFLGGFSQTSFNTRSPIWIVKVTSIFDRTWVIAIYTNGAITYLRVVPWIYWVGGKTNNTLYCGDNPEEYKKIRHRVYLKQNCKQTPSEHRTGHGGQEEVNNGYVAKQCKRNSIFSRILRYFKW